MIICNTYMQTNTFMYKNQVEIACRGQLLLPYWTLQHVRDSVWRSREATLLADSPSTNHVMTLQYGRNA